MRGRNDPAFVDQRSATLIIAVLVEGYLPRPTPRRTARTPDDPRTAGTKRSVSMRLNDKYKMIIRSLN